MFLNDGRSFCFQAQSQCDYFNISLSPQAGAIRKNTYYYHSKSLEEMVVKIKYMVVDSKDPKDKKIVPRPEVIDESSYTPDDLEEGMDYEDLL